MGKDSNVIPVSGVEIYLPGTVEEEKRIITTMSFVTIASNIGLHPLARFLCLETYRVFSFGGNHSQNHLGNNGSLSKWIVNNESTRV